MVPLYDDIFLFLNELICVWECILILIFEYSFKCLFKEHIAVETYVEWEGQFLKDTTFLELQTIQLVRKVIAL